MSRPRKPKVLVTPPVKPDELAKLQEIKKPSSWQQVRIFFKNSETIFLARIQLVSGFIVASVGALDWSPLVSLGASPNFTRAQVISLGSVLLLQGVCTELARRHKEPEMNKTVL